MRIPRIYQSGNYSVSDTIELSAEAFQHVVKVLRLKQGNSLSLFNGVGFEYSAHIHSLNKKLAKVKIDTLKCKDSNHSEMHLVQSIIKPDKMDLVIQKSVELGVSSITPLITEYCSVKLNHGSLLKKQLHWQKIIINACEQCGQNNLPTLNAPTNLNDIVTSDKKKYSIVLDPHAKKSFNGCIKGLEKSVLIIGPEGGFSPIELSTMAEANITMARLNQLILRAETAAIAAISVCQFTQSH